MSTKLDSAKLGLAGLVLAVGIVAFHYFGTYALPIRVLGLLVLAGAALAIAYRTEVGRSAWEFVQEARTEVRKVVWPTRQETIQTTMVVIAMVVVVALLLWLLDAVLLWAVRILTGQGG